MVLRQVAILLEAFPVRTPILNNEACEGFWQCDFARPNLPFEVMEAGREGYAIGLRNVGYECVLAPTPGLEE
jgi:hypothetical protein